MLAYSKNVQNVSLIYPKIRNGNGDNLNVNTVDSYIANLIVSLKVVMYSYRRLLMMMMVMMMIMMMMVWREYPPFGLDHISLRFKLLLDLQRRQSRTKISTYHIPHL